MNIVMVGGSHGIGSNYYKNAKKKGDSIKVLSRTQGELSDEDWIQCDILKVVNGETVFPETFETIDALIYLPGTVNLGIIKQFSAEQMIEDLKLNVVGAFVTVKACMKALKTSENASITLMSSIVAQTGMSLHSMVGSSKGAVEGLMRNLAAELSPKIRVNALAISLVDTPLTKSLTKNEKTLEISKAKHPLKRIGNPEEIAEMLQVLTHFSKWMTGQVVTVDGGISALR